MLRGGQHVVGLRGRPQASQPQILPYCTLSKWVTAMYKYIGLHSSWKEIADTNDPWTTWHGTGLPQCGLALCYRALAAEGFNPPSNDSLISGIINDNEQKRTVLAGLAWGHSSECITRAAGGPLPTGVKVTRTPMRPAALCEVATTDAVAPVTAKTALSRSQAKSTWPRTDLRPRPISDAYFPTRLRTCSTKSFPS